MLASLLAWTSGASLWLPPKASTFAASHDGLFYFILWTCVISFAVVIGVMTWFGITYRRRKEGERTSSNRGHFGLEVAWSVVPSLFLIVIFVWGFKGFMTMQVPPAGALTINVTAETWLWRFTHPTGETSTEELVIPVNRPVRLLMSSRDVIHSLYVPAFRAKRDVLPGRYTVLWFEATQEGTFPLYCTEYCGTNHSMMNVPVRVVSEEAYQQWLEEAGGPPDGLEMHEWGETLVRSQGCAACHSVDGSRGVGPSFLNLYGYEREFTDGTSRIADESYLRESILEPAALITVGYQNVMPSYAGQLSDEQLFALIAYIQTLSDRTVAE